MTSYIDNEVTVEVAVYIVCDTCSSKLHSTASGSEISVYPCQKCLDEAYEEGKKEPRDDDHA